LPTIETGDMEPPAPCLVVAAVPSFGKTTIAAYAPAPLILMASGERGYETLLGAHRVPAVPRAMIDDWTALTGTLDGLLAMQTIPYETLALDALGGFERQCHEFVCRRDFGGNWGEKGFGSYQKGYDVSVSEWLLMLSRLERLRVRGLTILCLAHTTTIEFKNPDGADYSKYALDIHRKTWGVTHKWADAVVFGKFENTLTNVIGEKKLKGLGKDAVRTCYTEPRDAYDAKNRFGMRPEFQMPDDPALMWATLTSEMKGQQS